MISKINSVNDQGISNPSFGRMSVDVKRFVRTPNIKNHLEKVGIDKDALEILDKSPVRISLLKYLFEQPGNNELAKGFAAIPDTAGLIVAPPQGAHLPKLCVTANDGKILEANEDSFIFSMQKVVELVDSYKTGRIKLNNKNRLLKVQKIEDLHSLDNAISLRLKDVVDRFNYSGGEKAIQNLVTDINHINKVAFLKTRKYDDACAKNKKEAMAVVRDEWLDINARRFDASV